MARIAIVCNSRNNDLIQYFTATVENLRNQPNFHVTAFGNASIKGISYTVTSLTRNSFLDFRMILDGILGIRMVIIALLNRVECVHYTTAHFSNLFSAVLCRMVGLKVCFSIHDLQPHPGPKQRFIELYNNVVMRFLANRCLLYSHANLELIYAYREKLDIYPLSGLDRLDIQQKPEDYILFFGRIEAYKGLGNLLTLADRLEAAGDPTRIIIAGRGYDPAFEQMRKNPRFTLMNEFIKRDQVHQLFQHARYTILPYDSATQSGVILESFAHGIPVIIFDVGALAEYVEDGKTGHIVPHGDIDRLVELLTTWSPECFRKMSEQAIAQFDEKHSMAANLRDSIELYERWCQ